MNNRNIGDDFEKLKTHFTFKVNGVTVERMGNKFLWNRTTYDTISQVRDAIDKANNLINDKRNSQ